MVTPIPGRTYAPGDSVSYDEVWQLRVVEDLHLDRIGPFVGLVAPVLYGDASRGFGAGVQIDVVVGGATSPHRGR